LIQKPFGVLMTVTTVITMAACSTGRRATRSQATSTTVTTVVDVVPTGPLTTLDNRAPCQAAKGPAKVDKGPEASPPGDIPDNQAFVAYTPASGAYNIKVPEGWARSGDGNPVTFTDKFNTVKVALTQATEAPTANSAQAQEVPAINSSARCTGEIKVMTTARKAGAVILLTYHAEGEADSVTGKVVNLDVERYEYWHNGTEAVVTLSSAAGSDSVDPWRTVTDSFTWKP